MRLKRVVSWVLLTLVIMLGLGNVVSAQVSPPPQNPQSGAVGVQGTIPSPPPTVGATISLPRDGQTFTELPVTVSGICPKGLLVKLFKNNIFTGSQQCENGSFSIQIDLFTGTNELVARVYDALDQSGPESNKVTVTFVDNRQGASPRVTLTSDFAKRGANPGQKLTWPIIISGGSGPYAVSVDWGDGKAPDLKSIQNPGTFEIDHIYDASGVYNIIIKATDKNGVTAFLQLVGIANGALAQDSANNQKTDTDTKAPTAKIVWQPAALSIPFILSTFWLGKRYELHVLKKKIERGDRPF